jgi:carbonic anhydrase
MTGLRSSRAEAALAELVAGNQRYRSGTPGHPNQGADRRLEVAEGQRPNAMCLGCADSRVSPEILFDQGLGDLFTQRVAGNVADTSVLASIEYAAQHLGVPLLLVLGHSSCGAVGATIGSVLTGQQPAGHIGSLVSMIRPAIAPVLAGRGSEANDPGLQRECAIANVAWVIGEIRQRSLVVADLMKAGEFDIVGGYYDLTTGAVKLV